MSIGLPSEALQIKYSIKMVIAMLADVSLLLTVYNMCEIFVVD